MDSAEKDSPGAQVTRIFPNCDFYIDLDRETSEIELEIKRFLNLILCQPWYEPTIKEQYIFQAFATSVRSLDLSRQVGAVLTDSKDELLTLGFNEVPKFGGGPYTKENEDSPNNRGRDYVKKRDANKRHIQDYSEKFVSHLREYENNSTQTEPDHFRTPLNDLTEFGRAVHAEMECLMSAARKGISTKDSILYVTTFPCHNCAKHLLSAGVKKVIFVEPYPKSKASDLYPGEIEISVDTENNEAEENADKMVLSQFCGIGPNRLIDLFSINRGDGIPLKRSDSQGRKLEKLPLKSRYPIPEVRLAYWEAHATKRFLEVREKEEKLTKQEKEELEKFRKSVNEIEQGYKALKLVA